MIESEFLRLDIDVVVAPRHNDKEEYYVIYDSDQMGTAYRGKIDRVFGAIELDGYKQIRIDKSNYSFWDVVGKMRR